MIFSIVEKVSEQEKVQKVMIKGSAIEISTELENILKELLKRNFPEELLIGAVIEAVESNHNK